jgi:hypothetical protein
MLSLLLACAPDPAPAPDLGALVQQVDELSARTQDLTAQVADQGSAIDALTAAPSDAHLAAALVDLNQRLDAVDAMQLDGLDTLPHQAQAAAVRVHAAELRLSDLRPTVVAADRAAATLQLDHANATPLLAVTHRTAAGDVVFTGVNVRVESGTTECAGLGNVVVGAAVPSGCHSVLVGSGHASSGEGALLVGQDHDASGDDAVAMGQGHMVVGGVGLAGTANTVVSAVSLGGRDHVVEGPGSAALGGVGAWVSGHDAASIGGDGAHVSADQAASLASDGTVSGHASAALGGANPTATGRAAVATGGMDGLAGGAYSSVIGGGGNETTGSNSATLGGADALCTGQYSATVGGESAWAYARTTVVLGGQNQRALVNYAVE